MHFERFGHPSDLHLPASTRILDRVLSLFLYFCHLFEAGVPQESLAFPFSPPEISALLGAAQNGCNSARARQLLEEVSVRSGEYTVLREASTSQLFLFEN